MIPKLVHTGKKVHTIQNNYPHYFKGAKISWSGGGMMLEVVQGPKNSFSHFFSCNLVALIARWKIWKIRNDRIFRADCLVEYLENKKWQDFQSWEAENELARSVLRGLWPISFLLRWFIRRKWTRSVLKKWILLRRWPWSFLRHLKSRPMKMT